MQQGILKIAFESQVENDCSQKSEEHKETFKACIAAFIINLKIYENTSKFQPPNRRLGPLKDELI